MRILGIETSGQRGELALLQDQRLVATRINHEPHTNAERLVGLLAAALDEAGWARSDIECVAVGVGPGSFTGLRVGIAFAQGLAVGLDVPLVGVPSLSALAAAASTLRNDVAFCPITEAHRGEAFVAAYDPDGNERLEVRAVPYAEVATYLDRELADRQFLAVGLKAQELLAEDRVLAHERCAHPSAEQVARLAERRSKDALISTDVTPLYARDANATLPSLPPNPLSRDC